jgi:FkbM family methyltransferase
MRQIAGTLPTRDRLLVALCRRSYRFYNSACIVVTLSTKYGEIKIPLINGVGLRNLSFDHNPLNPTYKENWIGLALRAIYHYRSGTFVDCGVNIGKILINLFLYNHNIRYIGFEPNINCCFYINQLIELNKIAHYQLIPVALSNHTGTVTLAYENHFDVRGSIVNGFHSAVPATKSREVLVDRGDRFLRNQVVAAIKLDLEGSELAALQGLAATIAKSHPVLMLELLDFTGVDAVAAEIRREAAIGTAAFLAERDYALYRVTSTLDLEPVGLKGIERCLHHIENNYIAVPEREQDNLLCAYQSGARKPVEVAFDGGQTTSTPEY